ncbi:fasciclin-like arabinogalactan protein 4 [Zingiber officinale]|uniref:fasciclin-like arabinogalactan protein 4 n=1 Tax=Zingiber officinale TaxID=94328 RepID=UPI001C4C6354|nr:fasciclin-like arabinogalactan protein 4 [Zingiber officinale]
MAGGEAPWPPLLCRHLLRLRLLSLFLTISLPFSTAVNITAVLSAYTDLADFNRLLVSTSIPVELSGRSSLTILAVPNAYLLRSAAVRSAAAADIADVLRYHVLLEYLSWSDLGRISSGGKLVTTLYQTTGRAAGNLGAVNLTRSDGGGGAVIARSPSPFSSSNATVLALVGTLPYNVSVFAVDALLLPSGFDLAASETRPPVGVNITRVLVDGHDFNVAASMLEASGVAAEFEADEHGAGITIFVPTDEAFADLPATERLQSLPADRKAVVLRFHVLHSYYPLGSLESIVNPVQPTLATENTGAGRFTLNITRVNGSVAIDTGMVQASITRTVFDQNPVAIFAVSKVLLPREIFAGEAAAGASQLHSAAAPPLDPIALPPQGADAVDSPPARLSSPPGAKEEVAAAGAVAFGGRVLPVLCSTASLYLMLPLV